jgi:DNA-binding CsgD family transcriptional regulator
VLQQPPSGGAAVAGKEAFWKLFADSRIPMLILDDEAFYTAANQTACQALARERDDIVGRQLGFTTAPEHHRELYGIWTEFRRTGYAVVPWQFLLPDGRPVDVEAIITRDAPEPGSHLTLYWQRLRTADGRALSPREQEVTRLLASGLTGEQIAQRLYLSPETVRTHIRNAMSHMRAQTRSQLVALAVTRGLIPTDLETDVD